MSSWNDDLDQLLVAPTATIRTAMRTIDRGAVAIALVVDDQGRLVGTISDGDVRRALLAGAALDDPAAPHINPRPSVVREPLDRAAVLDLMRARHLSQIPELDQEGRLVGLHVLQRVLGSTSRPNGAIILAGGLGTRLKDFTKHVPKPMLPVAGRPILERLVLHLVGSGISNIFLSVSYLAEQIKEHFGDGERFGCRISYLEEEASSPLGTGGPLGLLRGHLSEDEPPLLVMNGDLLTSFSVEALLDHHAKTSAMLTVALTEYIHQVPYGVARLDDDGLLLDVEEKPTWSAPVNAGIYCVDPSLVERVPREANFPMTGLLQGCIDRGERVSGWLMNADWRDVGVPAELARARGQA